MKTEILNAVIESAELDDAGRGSLNCWVHLNYGSTGQGFGGYTLYLPNSFKHHRLLSHAGHFIWRVMEIAGVTKWSDLKGKTVRVKQENGLAVAIGHIVNDDWFCPADDFEGAA